MKFSYSLTLAVCVLSASSALTPILFAKNASESTSLSEGGLSTSGSTQGVKVFEEALQLIRTHLVGASEKNFDEQALRGLVEQLSPSVQLLNSEASKGASKKESATPTEAPLCSAQLFDSHYLGLKLGKVAADTPQALFTEFQKVVQTNELKGIVLDLRNTGGDDYQAAAALISFFVPQNSTQDKKLFSFSSETYSLSTAPTSAQSTNLALLPRVLLINKNTSAGAEAIAAVLRKNANTLLIGVQTAGDTLCYKDFPLQNNQTLRIAVDTIRFPNGTSLPLGGIQPDIEVSISKEDEQAYLADPFTSRRPVFKADNSSNTNKTSLRINEAELVKMQNDAGRTNSDTTQDSDQIEESPQKIVYDPLLARALDLLKTLPFWGKK